MIVLKLVNRFVLQNNPVLPRRLVFTMQLIVLSRFILWHVRKRQSCSFGTVKWVEARTFPVRAFTTNVVGIFNVGNKPTTLTHQMKTRYTKKVIKS